jgi:hypothetical protein
MSDHNMSSRPVDPLAALLKPPNQSKPAGTDLWGSAPDPFSTSPAPALPPPRVVSSSTASLNTAPLLQMGVSDDPLQPGYLTHTRSRSSAGVPTPLASSPFNPLQPQGPITGNAAQTRTAVASSPPPAFVVGPAAVTATTAPLDELRDFFGGTLPVIERTSAQSVSQDEAGVQALAVRSTWLASCASHCGNVCVCVCVFVFLSLFRCFDLASHPLVIT